MAEKRKDKKTGLVLRAGEYVRPNGSYEYKFKDATGFRRSLSAKTLKELRVLEDQATKNTIDNIGYGKHGKTLNDAYKRWLEIKRGLKGNTRRNYIYMYEHFVKDTMGKKKIKDIKKSDVKMFYNKMIEKEKLQVNTLETIHNVLHQIFECALDDDIIRTNPCRNAMKELKHNAPKKKRHALNLEEQQRFIEWLDTYESEEWQNVFKTLLYQECE